MADVKAGRGADGSRGARRTGPAGAEPLPRRTAPITREDAPEITDADYDALKRRNAAIEARFPGAEARRQPVRPGRARRSPRASPRCAHAVRMLSLENAFADDGGGRFRRPGAQVPGLHAERRSPTRPSPRSTGCRCRLRYEDGRAGAGRHARRRRDGRECHRERPHHRRHPAAADRRARRCWRCGARST